MNPSDRVAIAETYLHALCNVKPNRRTGSAGNRQATDFFAGTIRPLGYEIDATPFPCLDYVSRGADLTQSDLAFEVFVSPYSLACDATADLIVVTSKEELGQTDYQDKLLLLHGEICAEQLMPKNFVFYNPEHHQEIIARLERRPPAAIITATAKSPDQVGALYPFPLFVDGDFDIPNVYCTDRVGEELAAKQGETFRLEINAERRPSSATNVIARLNPFAKSKLVVTAHIDAYEETPGASDNASGTVVLLLLAEMLADYQGEHCLEIAALNGEDHYSAGGQMDYLRRYGSAFPDVQLVVNVDDVGYIQGGSSYSFYGCSPELEATAETVFRRFEGLVRGDPWFNGDHMIFVQKQVPAIAFTAELMPQLMRTVTHTAADTPDLIDGRKLVEVAEALNDLLRAL